MHPTPKDNIGILLVNLGTPDSTSWWDIRRYLKEFLSDRRVIEIHPVIWKIILYGLVLTLRPSKTAHAYQQIWRKETNESPLRYYTREQAVKLQEKMGDRVIVDWAMRYGQPSIDSRLKALTEAGCRRIAVIPLYPQYSATTTATVGDAVFQSVMKMRWQPTLRMADPYPAHPLYIQALKESIETHLETLDWAPECVIASFHGIPKRYFEAGDPYYCFCHKTTRLLRESLGWADAKLRLTFQSRFGKATWLEPYTEQTLIELAESGMKKIAVICPGFSSDCVETLEEINIRAREVFISHGGTDFTLIPCLNDSEPSIALLASIAQTTIAGWHEGDSL